MSQPVENIRYPEHQMYKQQTYDQHHPPVGINPQNNDNFHQMNSPQKQYQNNNQPSQQMYQVPTQPEMQPNYQQNYIPRPNIPPGHINQYPQQYDQRYQQRKPPGPNERYAPQTYGPTQPNGPQYYQQTSAYPPASTQAQRVVTNSTNYPNTTGYNAYYNRPPPVQTYQRGPPPPSNFNPPPSAYNANYTNQHQFPEGSVSYNVQNFTDIPPHMRGYNFKGPFPPNQRTTLQEPQITIEQTQPLLLKRKRVTRMDIPKIDPWHSMMSLRSGLLSETTWAIDILNILLYDDASIVYFDLTYLPGLLNVLLEHFDKSLNVMFDFKQQQNSAVDSSKDVDLGQIKEPIDLNDNEVLLKNTPNYTDFNRRGDKVIIVPKDDEILVLDNQKDWDKGVDSNILSTNENSLYEHIITPFQAEYNNLPIICKLKPKTDRTNKTDPVVPADKENQIPNGFNDTKIKIEHDNIKIENDNIKMEYDENIKIKIEIDDNRRIINDNSNCNENDKTNETDKKLIRNDKLCKQNENGRLKCEFSSDKVLVNGDDDSLKHHFLNIGKSSLMNGDINNDINENLNQINEKNNHIKSDNKMNDDSKINENIVKTNENNENTNENNEKTNDKTNEINVNNKKNKLVKIDIITNEESCSKKMKTKECETPLYVCDDPSLNLLSESQENIGHRCIALSNIIRGLSFVEGNEIEFANNMFFLSMLGKLLMLHHSHPIKKITTYDNDNVLDVIDQCSSLYKDYEWWWDYLMLIRENMLVILTNISPYINLIEHDELISRSIVDGLLHWSLCPTITSDPFASVVIPTSNLTPQRLAIESLCKLCVKEDNVNMVLATPPFDRLEQLCDVLIKFLFPNEIQVLKEFSINLLNYFTKASSSLARILAMKSPCISLLIAYIEQYESAANMIRHSGNKNFEKIALIGISLDMMVRAANTLFNLARHPDNHMIFMGFEQRLLNLVMSQILDEEVVGILAKVLNSCKNKKCFGDDVQ